MNQSVKMLRVALVVMATAAGNTMGIPRQAPLPCTPTETQALQNGVGTWAARVMAQSASAKAAAEGVVSSCDSDGDNCLSTAEFVTCIKISVDDSRIRDSCFDFLSASGDANGDGSVGVEELTQLFNLLPQSTGRNEKSSKRASLKRQGGTESACSTVGAALLQTALAKWLSGLISSANTTADAADEVKDTCDLNNDSSLATDEFVSCLKIQLSSYGISDTCFAMLHQLSDQGGDKIIDDAELLQLVSSVANIK